MKKTTLSLLILSILMTAIVARASGPVAVYAIVEKVVLEPNESAPERAQIWGVFSVRNDRDDKYSAAQRGYLYTKIDSTICRGTSSTCQPDIEKQTRAIWSDLKKKAGTGQAVGFGGGWGAYSTASGTTPAAILKIRKTTDKPESPDMFPLGNPVVVLGSSQADITAKLKAALPSK